MSSPSVLVDTNVLIDLASTQRPEHKVTLDAVRRALLGGADLCCLSSSLKDVYYICRRHYGSEPTARGYVRHLTRVMRVLDLTSDMVDRALASDEPDFEDGLVRAAAELTGCSHILTRDAEGFLGSSAKKVDAHSLAALFG